MAAYDPAGHDTQGVFDDGFAVATSSSYVPATQVMQEMAPASEYLPAQHTVHGVSGPSRSTKPDAHWMQPSPESSVNEPGAAYVPV